MDFVSRRLLITCACESVCVRGKKCYPSGLNAVNIEFVKIVIIAVKDVLRIFFQASDQIGINDFDIVRFPDVYHSNDAFFVFYSQSLQL